MYLSNSDTHGWVSANPELVSQSHTENVPVTAVPLPPTPTPTATLQPTLPPTATPTNTPTPPPPVPVKPIIHHFSANQYTITEGESVSLQWDLSNAQVAYLMYGGNTIGVTSPGGQVVSPAVSTVYTLVAVNEAGETSVSIEIIVNPVEDPGDPPVFNPGIVIPLFPTATPTPKLQLVPKPGIIVTPKPTLQLIPGFIVPKP